MRKILICSILIFLLIYCKKKDFQKETSFNGNWEYNNYSNKDTLYNLSFKINFTKLNQDSIIGQYCSIARNGSRIDCFKGEENNICAKIINDTMYAEFNSSWENSTGKAKLYFNKNKKLVWELGECEGELYLPIKIILNKESE